jgi:hypothetical protein
MTTRALVSGRIDKRAKRVNMRGVDTHVKMVGMPYDTSVRSMLDDAAVMLIERDADNYNDNGELIG